MQPITTIHITSDSIEAVNAEFESQVAAIKEECDLVAIQLFPLMKHDKTIRMDGAPAMRMEWHLVAYLQKRLTHQEIAEQQIRAIGIDPQVMRKVNEKAAKQIRQQECNHEQYGYMETNEGLIICKNCGQEL